MKRMKLGTRCVIAVTGLLLAAGPNLAAAVIDSFMGSPQELEYGPGLGRASTGPIALQGGVFETRELRLSYGGQNFVSTGGDGSLEYRVDEQSPGSSGNGNGYFEIIYTSTTPVDLLGDGATGFRLIFESAAVGRSFPARFHVVTGEGSASYSWRYGLDDVFREMSGPTAVDVPFSAFEGLDLTGVVEVGFEGFRISPAASFSLSSISTVPEAEVMILAGLAWLVLGRRGRKQGGRVLTRHVTD